MKQLFDILWCNEYGAKEHIIAGLAFMAVATICVVAGDLLG